MITLLQQKQVRELRRQGAGYKKIASQLNLSRDSVRNYCRGIYPVDTGDLYKSAENYNECKNCGALLEQPKIGRKRKFCCAGCRDKWWKENRDKIRKNPDAIYSFECRRCGKEFTAYGNANRQYCSHDCYIGERYWGGKRPNETIKIDMSRRPRVTLCEY